MPLFRTADKIVLFTHVPKCAGGSIEQALHASGFTLSFYDGQFWRDADRAWYRSSPQHLERAQLDRLFASDFFDYEFAVVRDPADRLLSAFNHQRRRIGRSVSFDRFLKRLEARSGPEGDYFSWRFDNHFMPAARFVGDGARVFRLEDRLETVLAAVSADLGVTLIPLADRHNTKSYDVAKSENALKQRLKRHLLPASPTRETLTPDQRARIRALYAEDYARFGWDAGGG